MRRIKLWNNRMVTMQDRAADYLVSIKRAQYLEDDEDMLRYVEKSDKPKRKYTKRAELNETL